jgi:hypothetical protein
MYNYLSNTTPDYVGETLDITPHTVLDITGHKSQILYTFKDGSHAVKSVSDQSYFDIVLQWEYLSDTDYETIMDLWHHVNKANGFERTFPWINPVDDIRYAVRFMSEFIPEYIVGGVKRAYGVALRIEGVYPI